MNTTQPQPTTERPAAQALAFIAFGRAALPTLTENQRDAMIRTTAETIVAYWERETQIHFVSIGQDECGCNDCQGRTQRYDYWRLKGAKNWLAAHPMLSGIESDSSDATSNDTRTTARAGVMI